MGIDFYEAMKKRRSIYAIGKNEMLPKQRIQEIVEYALLQVPSAFNSQTARVLLLFNEESSEFWSLTKEILKPLVPEDAFHKTSDKIDGFKSGYGTILFFEDQDVVKNLSEKFSLYAEHFPLWSLQSSGMLQYAIWTSLSLEGLGASLQHYNPLVDEAVQKRWEVPSSWKLLSQMPFGSLETPAGNKDALPLENRLWVRG